MVKRAAISTSRSHLVGFPLVPVLLSGAAYLSLPFSWDLPSTRAVLLGILCHQAILRRYEVDCRGWEMLLAYTAINGGLVVGYAWTGLYGLGDAFLLVSRLGAIFLVGLYGSMLVYRAFFHPVGHFPGPFAARLSNMYHMSVMTGTKNQYHLHLPRLQEKYGDFVRTGPREVTVIRASAVNLIYGRSSKCIKATWYDQNSGNPDKVGIENIRDKDKHGLRRRAWDRGLGLKALKTYESRVKGKVDEYLLRIGTGGPVNVTQETSFYAWDVMGDIAFSVDFHMLRTGVEHPAVDGLHWAMATAGVVTNFPWLMNMLRVIPGATGKFQQFADWCYEQVDLKRASLEREKAEGREQQPRDVMSWLIKAQQDGDRSASPTESSIREDARTLISAGSDTVALAFTNFLYFMAKNPSIYQKLQGLLDAEFSSSKAEDWSYDRVKNLPYIDQLIYETLRLRPPVPMGFLRETPPEGLQVDEVFIPGGVNVNVPIWSIHRDERYFDRALDFVPERWEELSPDSAAYMPFLRGPFACSGKAVAMMQMRMLISCVAMRYDLAFAPGEDGDEFWAGAKETMTLWVPELKLVFTHR